MATVPYNPLLKANLADSIARAILQATTRPLHDTKDLAGAGIYVIYYRGDLACYASIAKKNQDACTQPIYIGKAIPRGGRKGGLSEDAASRGTALRDRLGQHYSSIDEAANLNPHHFLYRSLVVDDIWIPLGENMLIEQFKPVWNRIIDGFGNKDPGNRRKAQFRSSWDVIHPGRKFAEKLGQNPRSQEEITQDLATYLETGVVPTRAKKAARKAMEESLSDEPEKAGEPPSPYSDS